MLKYKEIWKLADEILSQGRLEKIETYSLGNKRECIVTRVDGNKTFIMSLVGQKNIDTKSKDTEIWHIMLAKFIGDKEISVMCEDVTVIGHLMSGLMEKMSASK